ncbi:MAG: glycoside hydrolase family 38 [Verrucomicrobiota bacterium JB024]|nr:glycoside hydrolase family 38 [Verrucomicrobiota bacterium JB024]
MPTSIDPHTKTSSLPRKQTSTPVATTIHLIGNAHLDPVWLWDWREGLNEGISTCQAMVKLLEEFPETTFVRGEAAIYAHIERHAPSLFEKIRELAAQGRWDIVGGNYIQPDTNLPTAEALLRQFVRGKRYFRQKFGVEVTAAWAADSFGHSTGLPDILHAAGMTSFAFTRPQANILPLPKQAFWWLGAGGSRILAFRPYDGWYTCERANLGKRLDACLERARLEKLDNVAFFYGLGNHGGGPTRGLLRQIREWTQSNPDVHVEYSGLHAYFDGLHEELAGKPDGFLPEHRGELNFCLRGCSAAAARIKFSYRQAETALLQAERTSAATSLAGGIAPAALDSAWDGLLFNAFHDILPGSSIERALDQQQALNGSISVQATRAETDALTDLAAHIDTRPRQVPTTDEHPLPVPVLLWNPHPWPCTLMPEIEVSLDHRPLWTYHKRPDAVPVFITDETGQSCPIQIVREEHDSMRDLAWRKRAVTPVTLPPMGWKVLHMGLAEKPVEPPSVENPATAMGDDGITNGHLSIRASVGNEAVSFLKDGQPWLGEGLQARVYEDPWGSWGGLLEEPESWLLTNELERWKIDAVKVLETGPLRAALWVRLSGARSRIELTFRLEQGADSVRVEARTLWNERCARLKLVLPGGGPADYEVPGAIVRREPCGEVPGGRWVRFGLNGEAAGFASDALYGFDTTADEFRATVCRASRYASDVRTTADEAPWMPVCDSGELKFRFLLATETDSLPRLAAQLESPPVVLPVPATEGPLPACGGTLGIEPSSLRLLALKTLGDDVLEVRLQSAACSVEHASLLIQNTHINLGTIGAGEILTWRLTRTSGGWQAERVPATGPAHG